MNIHPTSIIDQKAKIHETVKIGPFCIIEDDVCIDAHTVIHSNVHIYAGTKIGKKNEIHTGAVLGNIPQDLKFNNEKSTLIIGDRNTIREYCTLNRGTESSDTTLIGNDCLLMAYVHVAHDCIVEDKVILANGVQLAGHSHIAYHAIIGAITGVHQFCKVGLHAFVGACRAVLQDVPPYILATGEPLQFSGINSVGLRRRNFKREQIKNIKDAYKLIYLSKFNKSQSIKKIEESFNLTEEVENIIEFISSSKRGLI